MSRRAAWAIATVIVAGWAPCVLAGQLRVWSSAVVVADTIRLGDLVEFRGMDSTESDALRDIAITDAPPQGGSRIVHHEMIRAALGEKGINLSHISLRGAAQCEVRRPAALQPIPAKTIDETAAVGPSHVAATGPVHVSRSKEGAGQSLREAITKHLESEFERFGGTMEVLFDQKDEQVLELTSPPLQFTIEPGRKGTLGLGAIEVQLDRPGAPPQTVRLMVRTALSRHVVTARRGINQGATVAAADVELLPVTFTHLDDLGVEEVAVVLGQRAKKFIPAGTALNPDSLEPVPLVLRGQLITLVSEVGGVRVITTAKAAATGKRGEIIRVRSVDDHKIELDAVVTGPGEARALGGGDLEDSKPRLAVRSGS